MVPAARMIETAASISSSSIRLRKYGFRSARSISPRSRGQTIASMLISETASKSRQGGLSLRGPVIPDTSVLASMTSRFNRQRAAQRLARGEPRAPL